MAKWLLAECHECGQFWDRESLNRQIRCCSKCDNSLINSPRNVIYSSEYLEEEQDLSDDFMDFEEYCRCQLTSNGEQKNGYWKPGEFRKPTNEEISDRGEFAVLEVEEYHCHVEKIVNYYRIKKESKRLPGKNADTLDNAWLEFWMQEYEVSLERMRKMRFHFKQIFKLMNESWYGDELIRRDMDDLWTSEWFHNSRPKYDLFADYDIPMADYDVSPEIAKEEDFEPGFFSYRDFSGYNDTWSTEELSQNVQFCLQTMQDYRQYFEKEILSHQLKAPPPVSSKTKIIWRKDGKLMHLTLVHPCKYGISEIEDVGTDPDTIYEAKRRIEAARWLFQFEEDLQCHMERERQMHQHLSAIADMLDSLNYHDKFLKMFRQPNWNN